MNDDAQGTLNVSFTIVVSRKGDGINCTMQGALRNEVQANHSQPQNKAIADRDKRMEIKPKHQGGEERRNPPLAPPPPKKKQKTSIP